jgi:hypothetical protein
MHPILKTAVHGAIGGVIGASCMTAFRMLAHRAGFIEQMVPQAVEAWARHRTGVKKPKDLALRHIADQGIHLGYGMVWGVLYALSQRKQRLSPERVLGFTAAQWLFGSFLVLPALKIARPEWKANALEIGVNLSAHLLYTGTTALVLDEFDRQLHTQPAGYPLSRAAHTG